MFKFNLYDNVYFIIGNQIVRGHIIGRKICEAPEWTSNMACQQFGNDVGSKMGKTCEKYEVKYSDTSGGRSTLVEVQHMFSSIDDLTGMLKERFNVE